MFKIFCQFKQISINNQQKRFVFKTPPPLPLFIPLRSFYLCLSLMNYSNCGNLSSWCIHGSYQIIKKNSKYSRTCKVFSKDIHFFKSKKRTLKSLRMFSIYGFYSIHGFRENISGFSQILTGFKPVSDSVSDLVSDSGFDRSIQFIHGIIQSAPVFSNTRSRFWIGFDVLFCRFKDFNESIYIFIKCVVISLCLSLQQQQKFSLNTPYSRARTLFYVFLRRLWTGSSVCQI